MKDPVVAKVYKGAVIKYNGLHYYCEKPGTPLRTDIELVMKDIDLWIAEREKRFIAAEHIEEHGIVRKLRNGYVAP